MDTKKATGARGSWFAHVDGDRFPRVHKHWWNGRDLYQDPNACSGEPKWDEFIDALVTSCRAILTDDESWAGGAFKRKAYIGLFEIEDVSVRDPNFPVFTTHRQPVLA